MTTRRACPVVLAFLQHTKQPATINEIHAATGCSHRAVAYAVEILLKQHRIEFKCYGPRVGGPHGPKPAAYVALPDGVDIDRVHRTISERASC